MATVDKWRTCLNESTFCKKLRENNARESNGKVHSESKGLVAVNDSDAFIWDEQASHLIFYNLKNILTDTVDRKERHQVKVKVGDVIVLINVFKGVRHLNKFVLYFI